MMDDPGISIRQPKIKRKMETVVEVAEELNRLRSQIGTIFDKNEYQGVLSIVLRIGEKFDKKWTLADFFNAEKLDEIILFLDGFEKNSKIDEILTGKITRVESTLNKLTLDELIAEYEKAEGEKKQRIEEAIAKRQNIGKKAVAKFIAQLQKEKELVDKKTKETIEVKAFEKPKEIEITRVERKEVVDSRRETILTKLEKIVKPEVAEKISPQIFVAIADDKIKIEKVVKIIAVNDDKLAKNITRLIEIERTETEIKIYAKKVAVELVEKIGPIERNVADLQKTVAIGIELRIKGIETPKAEETFGTEGVYKKVIEEKGDNFVQENPKKVGMIRAEKLREEIIKSFEKQFNEKGRVATTEERVAMDEFSEIVTEIFYPEEGINIDGFESEKIRIEEKYGVGKTEESWNDLRAVTGAVQKTPKEFQKITERYKKVTEYLKTKGIETPNLKETRSIKKLLSLLEENPTVKRMLVATQKFRAFYERVDNLKNNFISRAVIKISQKIGLNKLAGKVIMKLGGQAMAEFVKNSLVIMAEQGIGKGAMLIFKGIISGGVKAGTVAGGSVLASAVAAFQAIPILGQVVLVAAAAVMAAKFVWDTFIAPVVNVVKNFSKNFLKINPDAIKDFIAHDMGLGKVVGWIGQTGIKAGGLVMFVFSGPMLMSIYHSAVRLMMTVFPTVLIGLLVYMIFFVDNPISSVVPPRSIGGGNCVLKSEYESGGAINCDMGAPENNFTGVSRANFVRVATDWHSGKNYADECYNDVVNRALCNGINPTYALWAWVHESGASNYSIDNVEDFGIHGQVTVPAKDFNAQINYFLKLDPGRTCLGTEKIGDDYWLGWATNYLNGNCDPDFPNPVSGQTGREYLTVLQQTWSWVSNDPLPTDIHVSSGGQNCQNISQTPNSEIIDQYTDENGQEWICFANGGNDVPDFTPWDPTTPVPEGCPDRLPAAGGFTQGPFASGCSHQGMSSPAVDIGAGNGTPIYATHPGVVSQNYDSIYGYYIDLHGKCGGKDFYSRYAHMPEDGFTVNNGQEVEKGQQIGVINNTGSSTGPHIHYHISGLATNNFGQYLGLSVAQTEQLWGCCGSWNGIYCP